jgi:pyruvate/oxaloacetate carboxyltransferase
MLKTMHEFEIVEYEVRQVAVKDLSEIVKPEKIMELLKG